MFTRTLKTAMALAVYLLRSAWRRSSAVGWLVLLFAFYIPLAVVVPDLQAPLASIGFVFPASARYEISGTVRQTVSGSPAAAIEVSVGGYRTATDTSGHYDLRFASPTSQGISVVFRAPSATIAELVSAGPDFRVSLDEVVP